MKRIKDAVKGQANINTLLIGIGITLAGFSLNKADQIYAAMIEFKTWRIEHIEAMGKQTKDLNDLSIRLSSDEGKWRATAIETRSNSVAIKAIERKIGL